MSKKLNVDYDANFDLCQEKEDDWVGEILGREVTCYVDDQEVNCKTWEADYYWHITPMKFY